MSLIQNFAGSNAFGRAGGCQGNPLMQILRMLIGLLTGLMGGTGGGGGCGGCGGGGAPFSPTQNPGFGGSGGCSGGCGAGGGRAVGQGLNNFLGGNQAPSPSFGGTPTGFNTSPGATHASRGTGYYPHNSRMEGGYKDMKGKPLHTLQDFLAGRAPYVSVAMDNRAGIKYGQPLRIKELEEKYGRPIDFRVVDTGGAFKGKGTSRIDICTANRQASLDPTINGPLTLKFL